MSGFSKIGKEGTDYLKQVNRHMAGMMLLANKSQ